MNTTERAQERTEDVERATAEATTLVRERYHDLEVWVRLAFSVGSHEELVYHFDAFGPTIVDRPHVLVHHSHDLWQAVLAD